MDPHTVFHRKRLLFRRDGATWRLVGEGPATGAACDLPAIDAEPPPVWTRMRDGFRDLLAECEGPEGSTLDDGYPGLGGSNGCMPEMNLTPDTICPGAERACLTQAIPALNAFLGEGTFDVDAEIETAEE